MITSRPHAHTYRCLTCVPTTSNDSSLCSLFWQCIMYAVYHCCLFDCVLLLMIFIVQVHCSRYVNGHMEIHRNTRSHAMALSYADLSVWCYNCDAYVHNPVSRHSSLLVSNWSLQLKTWLVNKIIFSQHLIFFLKPLIVWFVVDRLSDETVLRFDW